MGTKAKTYIGLLFFLLCVGSFISAFFLSRTSMQTTSVRIGSQTWTAEIAQTPEEKMKGLMNREFLDPNHGMLFVFDTEDYYTFWMKNTLIPLDIIWINKDHQIVDIQTHSPCEKQCENAYPKEKARFVFEVNAHTFQGKIGDQVFIDTEF